MTYFKWGFIAAAAAFIVSFGVGIISGVGVLYIILRAIVFAFIFFAAGFALGFVINSFFPEIFSQGESGGVEFYDQKVGSRVNITLDTEGKYAVPELYKKSSDSDELGNIEDLVSGDFRHGSEGIDRSREESYNQKGDNDSVNNFPDIPEAEDLTFEDTPVSEKPHADKPVFNPSFGDNSEGLGGLPDLDAMAMAFFPAGEHPSEMFSTVESQSDMQGSVSSNDTRPERSNYTGNKPQPLKGDFDAKELAKGISTVLSKEK